MVSLARGLILQGWLTTNGCLIGDKYKKLQGWAKEWSLGWVNTAS